MKKKAEVNGLHLYTLYTFYQLGTQSTLHIHSHTYSHIHTQIALPRDTLTGRESNHQSRDGETTALPLSPVCLMHLLVIYCHLL